MKHLITIAIASVIATSAISGLRVSATPSPDESGSIIEILSPDYTLDPTTAMLALTDDNSSSELFFNTVAASEVIDYATSLLGRPYRRGGKNPAGFDCSGFTSHVFGHFGLTLSASSSAQYLQGEEIDISMAKPGDLIFFSGRSVSASRVGHVGMIVNVDNPSGSVTFIHSASTGGVKYDVYPDDPYYRTRYIGARRVME